MMTVAVPGRVEAEGPGLPLSWLWSWATHSPAWSASAFVGDPVQPRGRPVYSGHYVGADVTKAHGGAGSAPQRAEDGLAPYAPHDPLVIPGKAGGAATGFDAATSKRLPDRANARMEAFENADGSLTRRIAGGALNYQGKDGRWHPIDTRLVRKPDGRWHMAGNSVRVSLGTTSRSLAQIGLSGGERLEYDLAGAADVTASINGSTALYRNVLPNTDLELVTTDTGLKETLILHNADAATEWLFPLRFKGLTPKQTPDGSIELLDSSGKAVAYLPTGYMQDSYVDPFHGGANESTNVRYELVGDTLKVTADAAWLKDPKRVYPVRVDPTATTATTGDVFVDNNSSGPSHNGDNLPVGTWNGGTTKTRSFIHLDNFDNDGFMTRKISAAKLKLYLTWTYSCTTYRPFYVHAATQAWTVAGLTSGTYPGPSISSAIGSLNITNYSNACTNSSGNRSVGKWVYVPLNVATIDAWARGTSPNLGLALTASVTDNYAWKRFTSANYSSGQYKPVLELTYTANTAPQITVRHPANNFAATTLTPTLVARGHDPDNWPNRGLQYQFNVYNETGQTLIVSSGAISSGSWTVPIGKLNWGKTYLYTVQVGDRASYSAVYPAYAFSTPVPQPPLTSRLAQNAEKGFDPSVGNYTTSATDASVATIGPELELVRSYNSLDMRARGALGRGWSSLLDMRATETGETVTVTYPDGSEVAFGREANGAYVAPQGRFATLNGQFTLTDKDSTVYRFAATNGAYKIASITDANGRALTFTYDAGGQATRIQSASGRSLWPTWTGGLVASVRNDLDETWHYTYLNDNLTKVCDPTNACTTYTYTSISQHANTLQNFGPYSYWRLNEPAGESMARSGSLANSGVDNGVFNNVALGQSPALSGSTATSAGFSGTDSFVQLPGKLITDSPHQSISLWFSTTGSGVLAGTQNSLPDATPTSFQPALYVGTDGKLYGHFWSGAVEPMASAGAVNDGQWHHVVLAAGATAQSLYLDGVKVGTLSKPLVAADMPHAFLGTARWTGRPATTGTYGYYNGQLSDAAFFGRELTAQVVSDLHGSGRSQKAALTKITRPSGGVTASISYDTATGRVASVIDENGGVWTMRPPKVEGNSGVYAASVLGGKPGNYWRMGDVPGDTEAVNEVAGGTATYNGTVTLGAAGPFADATAAAFNGIDSAVTNEPSAIDTTKNFSISAWVRLTDGTRHQRAVSVVGSRTPGVWLGYNSSAKKWQATMYQSDVDAPASNRASSTALAALNTWTHLVTSYDAASRALKLYVNGVLQETVTVGGTKWKAAGPLYIGRGLWEGNPVDFWKGEIADVATFGAVLSADQAAAQIAASKQAAPVAITKVADGVQGIVMPVVTVGVTDPGGKDISYSYDLINGYRIVAQTDALGNTTKYGYDVGGYSSLTYDPRGVLTEEISDVRGNTVQSITCQDQAARKCSSVYYTYYPNSTSTVLTPDPRNDVMLTTKDALGNVTTYVYDAQGNQTEVIEPLGRKTTTTYTNGLPTAVTSPGGAVDTTEYNSSGDIVRTTDGLGKVTTYTYDAVGRALTETEKGLTTSFTYDATGRVLTQTEPGVTNRVTGNVHTAVTTSEYNADGFVTKQTINDSTGGDAPRTVTTAYNAFGQVASETDATGHVTGYEYDAYGNMTKEIEPDGGVVANTYDAEGNLLTSRVVELDLVTVSNVYDPAGRLASETDAQGHSTVYTYTDNGLEAKVVSTDGTTSFVVEDNTYDAAGNLIKQVTDNGGSTSTFAYDAAGRQLTSTVDPNGLKRTTTFTYSPDDDVLTETETDSSGSVVAFAEYLYDVEGNLITETLYPSAALSPAGRWKLDGNGDSGGNSKLIPQGTVGWATSPRTAVVLDGTNSLETAGPVIDTARSFTVSAWANPASLDRNRAVVAQQGGSESGFYLKLDSNGGDKWSFVMYNYDDAASPNNYATSTSVAPVNTWTHLTAVYDGPAKQMRLYVNGTLQTTKTINAGHVPWTSQGPLTVGRLKYHSTQTDYWNGQISDVQVYQKALTATEITSVHNGSAAIGAVARTSVKRDSAGLVTAETDPLGKVTDFVYDEEDRPVQTLDPPVYTETGGGSSMLTRPVTTVGYDTFDQVVQTKDANGNVTGVAYDAAGQVTSTTMPSYTPPGSSTPITPVARNVYDSAGNLVKATDERGNITLYTYDQLGRLTKQTAPNGGVSTFAYDLTDNLLSVTDPNGVVTSATYDQLDRRVTSTKGGFTTTYTYDTHGRLAQVRSPGGVTNSFTYNAAEELLTSTDGAGGVTRYTYDGAGRVIKAQQPDNTYSTTTFDLMGRALARSQYSATGTLLTTESSRYDVAGNVVETTDARGTKNTFAYDATGMVTSARQPITGTDAITISFGYDAMGNRTRFTDGRGSPFITTYNRWNLPESQIEPATARHPNAADRTWTMVYDAARQLVSQSLPGGVRIDNSYDNMGNLVRQTGSGAEVATADRVFGYDVAGRMTSLSGPGGTNTLSYDARDLLLSLNGPSGNSTFTYTADGNVASRVDAAGTTDYTYDNAGRLKSVSNVGTGVNATLNYNVASLVEKVTYNSNGNYRAFTYDPLHRVTSDELKTPAGASIGKITYGWDANGNLTSKATNGFAGSASNTYGYDLADRLASWNGIAYAYDKSGNRVTNGSRTFRYDERNRLIDEGNGTTYSYTARGTLRETVEGTVAIATLADAFGQVTRQYNAASAHRDYTYDGLGRVMRTGFAYTGLGNQLAADGDAVYTRDPTGILMGVGNRLAWTDLHTDVVGQFAADGTMLNGSTTYDPLGKIVATSGMLGNLGYQSEWTDAFTGRVNMFARWYNTSTGQFDTRDTANNDPLPDSINANRYQYGDGNPMTVTDPTGHWGWNPIKSIKKAAKKAWKKTTSYVSKKYKSAKRKVSSYVSKAKKKYNQIKRAVKKKIKKAVKYVKKKVKAAKKWVKKKYNAAKNYVKKKYKAAKKWVAKKYNSVKKKLKKAYHYVKQAGKKIISKAKRVVKKAVNVVKDAAKKTVKWVKEHKAEIAGFVVGAVVGVGCGALIGWTGVGAVACGALAGAAGSLVTGYMNGNRGWDLVKDAVIGGTVGALTGGLFSVAGAGLASGVRSAISGGLRTGVRAAGNAARAEATSIVRGAAGAASNLRNAASNLRNTIGGGGRQAVPCRHSFDPKTRVLMANGSAKAIKDIKAGERVKAADPAIGAAVGVAVAREVTFTHRNIDADLTNLRMRDPKTGRVVTIRTTQFHPFWNSSQGVWSYAKDLTPGTALSDGLLVLDALSYTGSREMRDLTVDDLHSYYILADTTPVLVHNVNPDCPVHGITALPGAKPDKCTCRAPPGGRDAEASESALRNAELVETIEHQATVRDAPYRGLHGVTKDLDAGNDPIVSGVLMAAVVVTKVSRWFRRGR